MEDMIYMGIFLLVLQPIGAPLLTKYLQDQNEAFHHLTTVVKHVFDRYISAKTRLVIVLDQSESSNVTFAVLKHIHQSTKHNLPVILRHNYSELSPSTLHWDKSDSYILFGNSTIFNQTLLYLSELDNWNPRSRFLVVLIDSEDIVPSEIERMFNLCWDKGILNVAILVDCGADMSLAEPKFQNGCVKCLINNRFQPKVINVMESIYQFTDIFFDKCLDLYGSQLRVSMFNYPPNAIQVSGSKDDLRFIGPDWSMMKTLLGHLKATPVLVPQDGTAFGVQFPNGSMSGSSGDVAHGRADVALNSRYIKPKRMILTEYSYPHEEDCLCMVVLKSKVIPLYKNLFLPFTKLMWFTIGCTLLIASLSWYLIKQHGPLFSVADSALQIFSSFLSISLNRLPTLHKERIFFIVWVLFSLVCVSAFQGSLTSYLTIPKYLPDINNLHDLDKSNLGIFIHPGVVDYLHQDDVSDIITKLSSRMIPDPNVFKYFDNIIKMKNMSAMLNTFRAVYIIHQKQYVLDGFPVFHIAKKCTFLKQNSYAFPRNSPLIPRFNVLTRRIFEAGMFNKWKRDIIDYLIVNATVVPITFEVKRQPLSLEHLQTAFYILSVGHCLSMAVLFAERLKKNC